MLVDKVLGCEVSVCGGVRVPQPVTVYRAHRMTLSYTVGEYPCCAREELRSREGRCTMPCLPFSNCCFFPFIWHIFL